MSYPSEFKSSLTIQYLYLSIYGIYIAPLQGVTTQKRSQPRPMQKGRYNATETICFSQQGRILLAVVLYGQVEGTRSSRGQPKKWTDDVKENLQATRNKHERSSGQQEDLEKSC